jgi:hypothetical protein
MAAVSSNYAATSVKFIKIVQWFCRFESSHYVKMKFANIRTPFSAARWPPGTFLILWLLLVGFGNCALADKVQDQIALLKDPDKTVRAGAATELGLDLEADDSRTIGALIACLKDPEPSMRRWSATALGQLGDKRAVEPLTLLLEDEDEHLRDAATAALAKINGPQPGIQGTNFPPAPVPGGGR